MGIVEKLGLRTERYQHLSRIRNMRRLPDFHLYLAFADILYSLRMEYKRLKLKEVPSKAAIVAEAVTVNGNYGLSSTRQMAQMAMRLPCL